MKFGHHGANHPVIDLLTKKVSITSQNHGFAVDMSSLTDNHKVTHKSLFDDSLQGVELINSPAYGFQGHPERQALDLKIFTAYLRNSLVLCLRKMPKREGINSVLVVGAGPIVIGQACEFDYSGVQACKALKEEGINTILVNSNPATIMTDPETADKIYIEPIHWRNIEKIIAIEKPDAILPTMGGQTALNTTLDLNRHKILKKYNVQIIGASIDSIDMAEDRELLKRQWKI